MALDDILESIRREAREEAAAILADAQAKADALLDEARTEASAREEQLAHAGDDRIRVTRRRTVSLAHLEAARQRRTAREAVYQRVLEAVRERLDAIRDEPHYEDVLGNLLDECTAVLPDPTVVRVDERDTQLARRLLADRGIDTTIAELDAGWGGIEIERGGRRVRNDLDARLHRADGYLRYVAGEIHPPLRGSGP
jgi:vacuolar-type H+-ATPase subunit E/Vma4